MFQSTVGVGEGETYTSERREKCEAPDVQEAGWLSAIWLDVKSELSLECEVTEARPMRTCLVEVEGQWLQPWVQGVPALFQDSPTG